MNILTHYKRFIQGTLCFLWILTASSVQSQQFPVQVTTTITPPYSIYLSDYVSSEPNSLQVLINVLELDRTNLRAKLRITIEGAGISIRTRASYVPPAIVLQGGVPELLTGFDLRGYFNPDNLEFSGISKAEFLQRGRLPEGFYTFKIEVFDYNRNARISNMSMANAWLVLNDPPILNTPFNGDKITATDPQNIMFSWTPRHTASPNAAFSTEYEFKLVEMYPGQENPDVAIRSSNSIFTTTTTQTSLNYGIIEPTLIPGKRYAFRIRAYDTSDRDLFKNNGFSETYVFQYGDNCVLPGEIEAAALDPNRIRFEWEPTNIQSSFTLRYRRKGDDNWRTKTIIGSSQIVPELAGSTTYEYQIQSRCGTIFGDYSPIYTVSTPEVDESAFVCGADMPDFEFNPNPLQQILLPRDRIKTADWDILIETAESVGEGRYTGTGFAQVPFLNRASVRVKFENILLNEDYRVMDGLIRTVYSENSRFVADLSSQTDEIPGDDGEEESGESEGEEELLEEDVVASEGEDDVEIIAGDITDIITNDDGTVTVVTADGAEEVITPDEDEDIILQDDSGDQWVVDSGGSVSGGGFGGGLDTNVGDVASGESLEEGEIMFGPVKAVFAVVPESISTDEDGYCTYENISAEVFLEVNDLGVANQRFSLPNTIISFKQHCENKDFKDVVITYDNPDGYDIDKIGFIDASVTSANLSVDNEGNISGGVAFSAGLIEDQMIQNVFVMKKGLSGDFAFEFSGGDDFSGSFDMSNVKGINIDLRKNNKLLASLKNGAFNEQNDLTGTMNVTSGVVEFETSYFSSNVRSLALNLTYSFKEGMTINNGSAKVVLSKFQGVKGSITLNLSYLDNISTAEVESSTLSGFGMQFNDLNLAAQFDEQFDLLELSGEFSATHTDLGGSFEVTDFLYNTEGLQTFNASGNITHESFSFVVEESTFSAENNWVELDAVAKVTVEGVDAVANVTGFAIDFDGNIDYDEINIDVDSDVTLGPILVKFTTKAKETGGDKIDGNPTREIDGEATILVKAIDAKGRELFKEVSAVNVWYRQYKKEKHGGLIEASLSWSGSQDFGEVQGINVTLSQFEMEVDAEENLNGDLSFTASLEEDKAIRDLFYLKAGISGSVGYTFAGEKSFMGTFDFSDVENINVMMKKGDQELASLSNGTFSGTVLTGQFQALPNATYTSNQFKVKINELSLNGSYDFEANELDIESGIGSLEVSNIQGLEGSLILGLEYSLDGNYNASIASESDLSGLGFTFSDFNLTADFTQEFELLKIEGGLTAQHNQIDSEISISQFLIENGTLETLDASGNIIYRGFDFDLSKCTYNQDGLILTADLAINATGTEAHFGVKDFKISNAGEVSLSEVEGDLNYRSHIALGFNVKMEENRFTGSFTGRIKTIGVGIRGTLDIGKVDDYNFAYVFLEGYGNLVLPGTGLKITTLGGQIGYNYSLVYNTSTETFEGEPKDGNYLLGLSLGVADMADMVEIIGRPIVQFSSSSLDMSLDGTLSVTRNNPMISSNLQAQYQLPSNTLAGSITTSIKVPETTGSLFSANAAIGFGIADNNWHVEGQNLSASLLGVMSYSGSFSYAGQVEPYRVNAIRLNGNAYMGFAFAFNAEIGPGSVDFSASASFNSHIQVELTRTSLVGEMGVDVKGNLDVGVKVGGYDLAELHVSLEANAVVGIRNTKGYVKGRATIPIDISFYDFDDINCDFNHEFDVI